MIHKEMHSYTCSYQDYDPYSDPYHYGYGYRGFICALICLFLAISSLGSEISYASSSVSGAFTTGDNNSDSTNSQGAGTNSSNDNYIPPEKQAKKDDGSGGDIIDTILEILTGLTCETQGVGNLLRTEFSHTCIPDSFLTFFIANILSPGIYANTFLRVTMNNDEMFPDACKRANRLDPKDPRMTFGMCSNIKLAIERVKSIIRSVVEIASALVTGEAPWEKIKAAWKVPPQDYHKIYKDKKEGDWEVFVDLGIIPVFPWKIIKDNDKLCVATIAFTGWIPVGCKYIKEPYPESIYHAFFNPHAPDPGYGKAVPILTSCSNMGQCHYRAYEASRSVYTVSAPLVECIKEMVAKLMVSKKVCSFDDLNQITGTDARADSTLFKFQRNMHRAVMALLTIYVIFFGFRILLSGGIPEKVEIVNFVIKFLFVTYFSVGINVNITGSNDYDRLDGMVQWALPFMLNGMTQIASWIINATPSELCTFAASEYTPGMEHIAVWDSLDCRISHYIGLDMIQTAVVANANMNHDFSNFDVLSFPIPPYLYLLIPALISGQITLVMLAIMYPLMVISVGAFVVYMSVVCIISIAILAVLAPLFVPMFLFEFTKGYFESWAKLLLSFMLQPMVAVTFMTAMLAVYDFGFYGTCKYTSSEISETLSSGGKKTVRIFFVDNNWEKSYENEKEIYGCKNSLGYMLNNPFAALFDAAKTIVTASFGGGGSGSGGSGSGGSGSGGSGSGVDGKTRCKTYGVDDIQAGDCVDYFPGLDPHKTGVESTDKYEFMGAVQQSPGLFFSMFEVVFEWIRKFILALVTAIITLYLMYHFSESLANFAADMTEGVSIANMSAINPQSIYKAGMSALGAAGGALGRVNAARDRTSVGTGSSASDKLSTDSQSGSKASDRISGGALSPAANDKISTGSDRDSSVGDSGVSRITPSLTPAPQTGPIIGSHRLPSAPSTPDKLEPGSDLRKNNSIIGSHRLPPAPPTPDKLEPTSDLGKNNSIIGSHRLPSAPPAPDKLEPTSDLAKTTTGESPNRVARASTTIGAHRLQPIQSSTDSLSSDNAQSSPNVRSPLPQQNDNSSRATSIPALPERDGQYHKAAAEILNEQSQGSLRPALTDKVVEGHKDKVPQSSTMDDSAAKPADSVSIGQGLMPNLNTTTTSSNLENEQKVVKNYPQQPQFQERNSSVIDGANQPIENFGNKNSNQAGDVPKAYPQKSDSYTKNETTNDVAKKPSITNVDKKIPRPLPKRPKLDSTKDNNRDNDSNSGNGGNRVNLENGSTGTNSANTDNLSKSSKEVNNHTTRVDNSNKE